MKLYICGYARHGKDTAADILKENFGLTHESSSMFCMRLFLREQLQEDYGLRYDSGEECFADRVNQRSKWHDLITRYNRGKPERLSNSIFREYDIYVGIRSKLELEAGRKANDALVMWIDDPRKEPESAKSNKLTLDDADFIVMNSGTIDELEDRLITIFNHFDGRFGTS